MVKEFVIGGIKYKVEEVDRLEEILGDNSYFGIHDQATASIKIARTSKGEVINEDIREMTILHEVLHAIFRLIGSDLENKYEEKLIEQISPYLYEYLKTKK
jgi:hypothetical protein